MDRSKHSLISCASLEQPGRWRSIGVTLVLLTAALPAIPLLWHACSTPWIVSGTFIDALINSVIAATSAAVLSFAFGLPLGIMAALYDFPGRKALLAISILPVVVPSLLWAIGWSALASRIGAGDFVSELSGCTLLFSIAIVPLVILVTYAACTVLTGTQVDAVRLSGGEGYVLLYVSGHAFIPAMLAAGLGGVLTLSDPGAGQILGLRTAASEILISFSALYEFAHAGQQCLMLTALVLLFATPLACFAAPRIASGILAQQTRKIRRIRHKTISTAAMVAFIVFELAVIMPLVGLVLPLQESGFNRAFSELGRTAGNTLFYAVGAGVVSLFLGLFLAFFVGRQNHLRTVSLGAVFALFSLPPAMTALGFVYIGANAPAWTDIILRSRLTVCLALGLRFFPIAAVFSMRAWSSTSPSWALAAGIHGVSLKRFLRLVILPSIFPACAAALLLVALFATADVSSVLLVHPPGAASFPLAIFTVMANAPESVVAYLCLIYVIVSAGCIVTALIFGGRNRI